MHFTVITTLHENLTNGKGNNAKTNSYQNKQSNSIIKEVKIGNQIWMAENLNVDKFRNGDPIPEAKSYEEWNRAGENKQPAWCYYDNDPSNGKKYGKLYNWYAVNDPRGLAPNGWHIPNDEEWTKLTEYLGGEMEAGNKMKNTSGWHKYNGTNESGFLGLPGGGRSNIGEFYNVGGSGDWWSSTETYLSTAWYRNLGYGFGGLSRNGYTYKDYGLSVRCLRD